LSRRSAIARLGGGGLVAGTLAGIPGRAAAAQDEAAAAATEAVVRQAIEAINAVLAGGDVAQLEMVFAPDYVNHTPYRAVAGSGTYPPNLAGLQRALTDLRAEAPGAVLVVEDIVASGDSAAVRVTFRGSVTATTADTSQATTYPLAVGGMALARVRDGLIVQSWDYDEFAELFGTAFGEAQQQAEGTPAADDGVLEVEISGVDEATVQGIGTLRITQGESESLTIEAEPRVLRRLSAEVQDGRLTIQPRRQIRTREPILYDLTVRDLSAIALSGAIVAEAAQFTTDALTLDISGSSSIAIEELTAETLNVSGEGNASVTLAGTVPAQTVQLSGSSQYAAGDLVSQQATLTVSGASQARVHATEQLDVEISGAGSVVYSGDPQISQQISGVGSLTPAQ
jgi:hypothetical protein